MPPGTSFLKRKGLSVHLSSRQLEEKMVKVLYAATNNALKDTSVLKSETVFLEKPRNEAHGDYAASVAMRLAKVAHENPRKLGEAILEDFKAHLKDHDLETLVEDAKVEGPGFLNFKLSQKALSDILFEIRNEDETFGHTKSAKPRKVLVEFVSANPTGPLTIAHGRQAALGDSLVRILKAHGCDAQAEYYNNDVGVQIRLLGESLYARCLEHSGKEATLPEQGYRGEYLKTLAEELLQKKGDAWLDNAEEALEQCQGYAREEILKTIKKDLEDFNVQFDRFYSQEALDKSGEVEKTLEDLKQHKAIYEKEGAVWFRSTSFGDDKDRVVVKSDSSYTYLMPDIAYHRDKFHRGFQEIVDILGPDHHGYIARLKGSQEALGYDPSHIRIIIAQLVTLYEGKKQLKMSTRAGEFVTLRELLENVGKDAARYFFLLRNADTHLDFDLELAKSHTPNNPVFYIQYAHARVSSINRMLLEKGVKVDLTDPPVELLKSQEEVRVLRHLRMFPKAVAASANQLEPHILGEYLEKLAALFHQFYQKHRVITDDIGLTAARILLVNAIQIVVRNGLTLLGVSAPESM